MVGKPLKLDLACLCQDVAKGFELHLVGWGWPANPGQTTIQSLCSVGPELHGYPLTGICVELEYGAC